MVSELLLRFALGGAIVSVFAVVAEVIRPKTLAGIFGASPSIGVATLAIACFQRGGVYVATEGRSMLAGSVCLIAYAATATLIIGRERVPVWLVSVALWCEWAVLAFGIWWVALRN
jgi:hypothetical protein